MTVVYLAGVLLGVLTARIAIFGGRGGIRDVGLFRTALSAAAFFVTFCLALGGFIWLSWYWPVVAILLGVVTAAAVVTRDNWASLFAVQPVIDTAIIILGCYWLLGG